MNCGALGFDVLHILAEAARQIGDLRGVARIWYTHGEFPGNCESRNLSMDNISREIGRTPTPRNTNYERTTL